MPGLNPAELVRIGTENLKKALEQAEIEGEKGMKDVGVEVTNAVRKLLSTPGTGRVYRRRGGRTHRASAPGQPPAVDTGKLRASYGWNTGKDPQGFFVDVGTSLKYAPMLEYGTRRMKPRPALRPAVEQVSNRIPELIAEAWANGLKVAVGRMPTEIEVG